MIAYLESLNGNLNPEQEILRNRMVIGAVCGTGCFFFAFDSFILSVVSAYLLFNSALYLLQARGIWRDEYRWLAAIISDVAMAFAIMLHEPEGTSLFYPVILWMILANGFRYGVRWLYIASILSTLTFGFVVLSAPYWQQNLTLGLALALALLIIPAYCTTIIRKISLAKQEADAASTAKSYFLASVSHELRTPLNAIIGYGNHLRQSEMPRGQKEMVEASVLAGEHLLHLIEQLIEVAKNGAGSAEVKSTSFSPTELLTDIRHIMAGPLEDKGLSFHLMAEPLSDRIVDGPTDVVRNVLLNLVGNAIKFTETGGISIRCGFEPQLGEEYLWCSVSDTGIGIAGSAIERIFQPFQQADETVLNRFGGTGLGLAICKQLVEQVNGKIYAESTLGKGSTFHIQVPVRPVDVQHENHQDAASLVHVVCFGDLPPELLASAQSHDDIIIRHVRCGTAAEIALSMSAADLEKYDIALISEDLARFIEPESNVWQIFSDAEIAPVLVARDGTTDVSAIDELVARGGFASVLPAMPSFAEMRSAFRIGCAFARHFRSPEDTNVPAITTYQSRKILVADDNRTNRNVLGAILGAAGHDVIMVADGDEALEALGAGNFDILLLDVNMPRLNGIDACKMWRHAEGGEQHLPIVGVTADATRETETQCLEAGMDLRITKPVDAKLLLATIDQLCGDTTDASSLATGQNTGSADVVVPILRISEDNGDVIDHQQINYLMSIGDEAFVCGMIDGFFDDANQTLDPLRQAVNDGNLQGFKYCAHAIRSSSHNMGAKPLAELCGKFELISAADFDENRFAYLDDIEAQITKVIGALQILTLEIQKPVIASRAG